MARQRRTRAEQRASTRDALIDAASEVFAERGFAAASVDAIADRAGYTSGAIYDHFGSKEGVLVAVVERLLAQEPLAFDADSSPSGDFTDQLRAFGRTAARTTRDPGMAALVYEMYACMVRNPDLRERIGPLLGDRLAEMGAAIPTAGRLSGTDVVVLGQAILDGLQLRAALNPELVRDELFAEGFALLAALDTGAPG
jgi:AcrR family transcriptional regulator